MNRLGQRGNGGRVPVALPDLPFHAGARHDEPRDRANADAARLRDRQRALSTCPRRKALRQPRHPHTSVPGTAHRCSSRAHARGDLPACPRSALAREANERRRARPLGPRWWKAARASLRVESDRRRVISSSTIRPQHLGVSPARVSSKLASAAAKVGVFSRAELVRLAAMLAPDPRADLADNALTDAEREVLELLQHGLSNKEIAKRRSRSVRTIANQVASLLRKTKSSSRRALLVS